MDTKKSICMQIWRAVLSLLSHRHFWVQKAACRAFSSALAHAPLAEHLMALPQLPASAALELFSHFEACAGDAGAATQAVKCMVAIASAVYACEVKENNGTLAQLGDLKAKRRRLNGEGDGKVGHAEVENVTANEEDVASDIDEGKRSCLLSIFIIHYPCIVILVSVMYYFSWRTCVCRGELNRR